MGRFDVHANILPAFSMFRSNMIAPFSRIYSHFNTKNLPFLDFMEELSTRLSTATRHNQDIVTEPRIKSNKILFSNSRNEDKTSPNEAIEDDITNIAATFQTHARTSSNLENFTGIGNSLHELAA